MANGDDEAMRAIQRKAQEALRRQEADEQKRRDFNKRRQDQLANEKLVRDASDALRRAQRNPTPANQRKAQKARSAANRGTGGGCAILLLAGTAGLVILTAASQIIRVIS